MSTATMNLPTPPKVDAPPIWASRGTYDSLLWTAVILALVWSSLAVQLSPKALAMGLPRMRDFLAGTWPPDWSVLRAVLKEVVITIQCAFVGTCLALVPSLPLGFLAARNLTDTTPFWRAIGTASRLFLNATRSIDALIFALIFVTAVGLGPFPGTLALAVHSIGMLGKLFCEAIEGVDKGPVEALEAVGATKLQMVRWAILPQAIPYFISYFLYRFELNIRTAVVLGLVGGGGIGFLLMTYMKLLQYQRVMVVVIVIFVLVMGLDWLSARMRRAVV